MLSGLIWDCNDNTCSGSSSLLSARMTHGFDSIDSNLTFDPGGSPFSNNSIGPEHNASSLSSSTLMYDSSSSSNNNNGSRFMHDSSGTSSSNALDHASATTASNDHIFDPGSVPSHSDILSSCVLHSIINHNQVLDPGGTSFSSTLDTSNAATTSNHSNHAFDPGSAPFDSSLPSLCAQHTRSTDSSSKCNNGSRSHKSKHGKSMHNLTNSLSNNCHRRGMTLRL
jgi:hypothetical protein